MDVHKDCYSAIDLTQQDGPHRRETTVLPTSCNHCGGSLRLLYIILDSTTGNQVRTFKCDRCPAIRTLDVAGRQLSTAPSNWRYCSFTVS
jgi:hypothetical protein